MTNRATALEILKALRKTPVGDAAVPVVEMHVAKLVEALRRPGPATTRKVRTESVQ